MGSLRPLAMLALAAAGALAPAVACGTSAVDVQGCKDIEDARCQAASIPACASVFDPLPVHNDSDVSACVRFYATQCLHGLETPVTPGGVAVNACVSTIQSAVQAASHGDAGACQVIAHPQNYPSCAFLNVPDAGTPDTGVDAADAGEDAG
jgi:hypothetical protein